MGSYEQERQALSEDRKLVLNNITMRYQPSNSSPEDECCYRLQGEFKIHPVQFHGDEERTPVLIGWLKVITQHDISLGQINFTPEGIRLEEDRHGTIRQHTINYNDKQELFFAPDSNEDVVYQIVKPIAMLMASKRENSAQDTAKLLSSLCSSNSFGFPIPDQGLPLPGTDFTYGPLKAYPDLPAR